MKNNKLRHRRMKMLGVILVSTALILGFYSETYSQTEKGLWRVGGSIGFNKYEGSNRLMINPSAGYFFTNHLSAGAGLSFSLLMTDYSKSYGTGFSPYISYYFGKGKLQPVLSISAPISYYSYKVEEDYGGFNSSEWSTNFVASAGISYFLNDNAAISGALGYNVSSKNFYLSFGFQVFLGTRKE